MGVSQDVSEGPRAESGPSAPLVDLVPGVDGRLADEDRRRLARFQVPLRTAFDGPFDLEAALRAHRAFALVIAEGMLLRTLGLGEHIGLQMLGPGDVVGRRGTQGSDLLHRGQLQVRGVVRYAALDDRVLALAQRYPRLIEGLQMRRDDQEQRLLAQLLICQQPRVEDRVLALMWLLAETWGRVTSSGTALPIRLTHDAIGLLVGARRSTVTLALGALEGRGALLRRPDDWLILESLQAAAPAEPGRELPRMTTRREGSPWDASGPDGSEEPSVLSAMQRLRTRRAAAVVESRAHVAAADATSRRSRSLLTRVAARQSVQRGLHHQDDAADLPVAPAGGER